MRVLDRLNANPTESGLLGAGLLLVAAVVGYQSTATAALVLLGAVGCVIAVVAFLDLTLGLVILTALTFFELVPGFGAGDLSAIKIVGLVITLSWLARIVDLRSSTSTLFDAFRLYPFVLIAFVTWALVSAAWARNADTTTQEAIRLALVVILTFVTFSAIREAKHLTWVLVAFVVGAASTTAYGMVKGLAVGRDERLVGGILNPNELAAALVPAVIIGVFLIPSVRSTVLRIVIGGAVAMCLVGLLLTQSRAAFVGLAAALVFALFVAGPMRPAVVALAVVLVVVGAAYYTGFTSPDQRERLTSISARGSSGRADEWRVALGIADDHTIIGVGFNNYQSYVPQYLDQTPGLLEVRTLLRFPPPHNTYLQVVSELGVIGLVMFLAVIIGALVIGLRAIAALARSPDRPTELAARGAVIAFFALVVIALFANSLDQKSLWLMIGVLCSLVTLVPRLPSREAPGRDGLAHKT